MVIFTFKTIKIMFLKIIYCKYYIQNLHFIPIKYTCYNNTYVHVEEKSTLYKFVIYSKKTNNFPSPTFYWSILCEHMYRTLKIKTEIIIGIHSWFTTIKNFLFFGEANLVHI